MTASVAALQAGLASDTLDHAAAQSLRTADTAFAGPADTGRTAAPGRRNAAHAKRADGAAPRAIAADIAELEQALLDAEKAGLATLASGAVCRRAARGKADLAGCGRGKGEYQQSQSDGAQGMHLKLPIYEDTALANTIAGQTPVKGSHGGARPAA